jgi:hypothetical protein
MESRRKTDTQRRMNTRRKMESKKKIFFNLARIMAALILLELAGRVDTCVGAVGADGSPSSTSLSLAIGSASSKLGSASSSQSAPTISSQPAQEVPSKLAQTVPCSILVQTLLAKADPDECYTGVGNPYPAGPPCSEGIPKVNQTYVWGMAKSGDDLWFGTGANVSCMAMAGINITFPAPKETSSYVCEFGESQFSPPFPLPPQDGDWRPPKIYVYNTRTNTLTDKTPTCSLADCRINTTMGFRSAGALGKVVILGGPCLPTGIAGINLFAFRTDTSAYLGSITLSAYTDIRKWIVVNDVLYTAVRNTSGGGAVLRWRGTLVNPFLFEEVGNLDSEGVELAEHEGRIFVSTWPELIVPPPAIAGLYMSPVIPPGGLTLLHAPAWTKVWQADDYEPDPFMAGTYGGGALASYKGYLYWGTMHMPNVATNLFFTVFGAPDDPQEYAQAVQGTTRSISIFRGRNFGTDQKEIQLLYGEEKLWKYTPVVPDPKKPKWEKVNNNMGGAKPLYGPSGIGSPYNLYTWTMSVFADQLFVGTLDSNWPENSIQNTTPDNTPGADLFRFSDSNTPAFYEVWDGFGNPGNAGIRTMLSSDDALYIGTAGAANLVTDPNQPGGWKLIKLTVKPPIPNVDILPTLIAECGITLTPPTAAGNCQGKTIDATTNDPLVYTEPGTYTVTWTYINGCNSTTQTQDIVVRDTQPPIPNIDPLPVITGKGKVFLTPPTAMDSCTGKITAVTTDPFLYSTPGTYTVTWIYNDGHNNSTTQTQEVVVELAVDMEPGICPNLLNLNGRGTLSAAILGSEGFDPASSIDPASIVLGREGISETVAPTRQSHGDLLVLPSDGDLPALPLDGEGFYNCSHPGTDGYTDLIIDFNFQEVVRKLQLKDVNGEIVPLTITARLKADSGKADSGGTSVKGQDYVLINFPWKYFSKGLTARTTGTREWRGSLSSGQLWPFLGSYQRKETDFSPYYWNPLRLGSH